MRLLFSLLLFLSCLSAKAQQVFAISGTVTDEKGMPLPGATVFITNSSFAMATDVKGNFGFNNLQPGAYEVAVKMLGYNPIIKNITINDKPVNLIFRLTESVTALKTVNITANKISDNARRSYLSLFLKNFIGETVNAQDCKLLNPEALQFDFDRANYTLHVSADDFLIVENNALGYRIKYLLMDFEVNLSNYTCMLGGSPYFEELKGTEAQQKKWDINRRRAYLSSSRHFFRAVANNTAADEGFQVYQITDDSARIYQAPKEGRFLIKNNGEVTKKKWVAVKVPNINSFFTDTTTRLMELIRFHQLRGKDTTSRRGIYAIYTGEGESPLFFHTGSPINFPVISSSRKRQVSEIRLLTDTLLIDKNGEFSPAKGGIKYGYWAWQRIADLTPLDYFVEPAKPPVAIEYTIKDPQLKKTITAIDSNRNALPVEKLYIQTDKPYYTSGDTLHFKSYLLNADYLTPSTRSGLLYVELDDAANHMVKQIMVPVTLGISIGDIGLDAKEIPEGSYTLRAYTNWMRNFGEDYIFKKSIFISALSGSTLVNANFKLDSIAGKNKVEAKLQFADLNKNPLRLKDVKLKVQSGNKTLVSDKVNTGMDGTMSINFDLADKTAINNLAIQAQQIGKGADTATLTIPVIINRTENIDLQFMPEGGNLVAGLPAKVGFKAISEDGKGVNVSGKIMNNKQQEVARFRSTHKGMGSFDFTPQTGETYTATIGTGKVYPLPVVNAKGTTLSIVNKGDDSLLVVINSTHNSTYYLIGQSRGVVCYAAAVNFKDAVVKRTIAKAMFPTGVAHFTLLARDNQPLNERLVYINNKDNLQLSITTNKSAYNLRDSVALNLSVTDKEGNPVQSTFSLAVTDDGQVKPDSLGGNMLNNFLFTADLKGTVEEPGWYFENENPEHLVALDDLLLTQGWVGYDWKTIFNNKKTAPKYPAQKEFIIEGRVTNIFNKPVKQTKVSLMQEKPLLGLDTVTDDDGHFIFKNKGLFPVDTAFYLIQAKNKNGNTFNVGVDVDEFVPMVFAAPKKQLRPWYVNSDTILLKNNSTKIAQLKAEANYRGEGHLLKEVVIKDKKIIPGSHNLNGPGGADFTLDEKDMNAAKKMTLEEVLRSKYKNFYTQMHGSRMTFYLKGRPIVLILDGQRAPFPADEYMNFLTAEDIKGIEIMYNTKYALAYNPGIASAMIMLPDRLVPTYLEITTYSGRGAYLRHIPGRYLYKPLAYTVPKQFYSPRYTVKNKNMAMGTDLRSTIHWEPNIITDAAGKATISFFSADKTADYSVVIEGTDLNGSLGYKRQRIKVTSQQNNQ